MFQWFVRFLEREKAVTRQAWKPLIVLALVFGGIVLYGASGYYAALYEGTLRTAEQRIAYAQEQLEEANRRITVLEARPNTTEEAEARIDSLIQANQQLQREVEKLKAQDAEMRADIDPRRIKDVKHFISVLSLFRGQTVDVEYIAMDGEAENFLGLIRLAVEVSGWTIGSAAAMSGQTWDGVIVEVNDLREAMPAAYELKNLLVQQETAVAIRKRQGPPKLGRFTIRVGYKIRGRMTH